MNKVRRYFLPLVAGASLLIGLSAVSSPVASAKAKPCTVPTGCGTIKISPKSVTASATGTTVTVTGKGFNTSAADDGVNLVECQVGAVGEDSCDITNVVAVTIGPKGTFSAQFTFLSDSYKDINKDSCTPTGKTLKTCGIAAGNEGMTNDAGPVAVTIKAPKA